MKPKCRDRILLPDFWLDYILYNFNNIIKIARTHRLNNQNKRSLIFLFCQPNLAVMTILISFHSTLPTKIFLVSLSDKWQQFFWHIYQFCLVVWDWRENFHEFWLWHLAYLLEKYFFYSTGYLTRWTKCEKANTSTYLKNL